MAKTINTVRKIAIKQKDGSIGSDYNIGATFANVMDSERAGATGYTLDQFFDSYMKMVKEVPFIYTGDDEPTNSHVLFWVKPVRS